MADDAQQNLSELISALKANGLNLSRALVNINTTLGGAFKRYFGTFTLSAAAATTVTDTNVAANSYIGWTPTNAAAAGVEGSSKKLYISARTAGASFQVTTGDGVAAAGTETFTYVIENPS